MYTKILPVSSCNKKLWALTPTTVPVVLYKPATDVNTSPIVFSTGSVGCSLFSTSLYVIVSSARAVDHITEPHKIVDCYESDIVIWKENYHVVSGLQMLLTKK